ncbi:putative alpha/beta hydrolase-1 [Helianthus anomalus]
MSEAVNKSDSSSGSILGVLKIILVVLLVGFSAWAYQTSLPTPPKKLGSPEGLPITSPRIQLRDGRHLCYVEHGVPKDVAKSKIIYVHCFGCSKYHNPFAFTASHAVVEELGVYMVAIDRPGYGESDPDPKRTVKSFALDIEEFADHLNLGPKFYVAGFSMGGQIMWSCLKYIPHRLAGAILISPAVNYWWHNLPSNLTNEAYSKQLQQDQWSLRVAHYLPWLTNWWNTQTWFPGFSIITGTPVVYSSTDVETLSKLYATMDPNLGKLMALQPRQQGELVSIHHDLNVGFGKWEFDPVDLENPFIDNNGSVHLWTGDEDLMVPVTLQRYIARQLGWIKYHEVAGEGHMFAFKEGMGDAILKAFFNHKN